MGSSALEHAIKARKPYTISKQRERWSEEEHNKFIEALKLHGRAWREIEDLVGTKTAVQIRSHAQKFFTKVIRESTSVNSSQVKSMEIPPPRPKKKPMHPYPRKLGNIPNSHLMKRPEWSLVPQLSAPGQEDNLSPTSIVSIVGSDTFGSSTSPVSSVVGSDPAETLTSEQENGSNSTTTTSEHRSYLDLEFATNDNVPCKEPSAMEAPATSLRLFGKTMVVADPQKPLCSTIEEAVQCYNPFSAIDFERQHQQNATDWNSWQKRATQMFILLPYYSNTSNFEAGVVPMPSPLFSVQKEDSFTESNALSSVEASIGDNGTHKASVEDCDDHDAVPSFKLRQSERSAFRSLKSISEKPTKGFMPYKRCVSDREVDNQKMVSKNGEGQVVQLCL